MIRILLISLCAATAGACSSSTSVPEIPSDHPASTDVVVVPIEGPSGLLDHHDPLPTLSNASPPDAPMGQHEMHDHGAMENDAAAERAVPETETPHDHQMMRGEDPSEEHREHQQVKPAQPDDASAHQHPAEQQDVTWVCPMHPDQTSPTKANCPLCGMEMVPRSDPEAE